MQALWQQCQTEQWKPNEVVATLKSREEKSRGPLLPVLEKFYLNTGPGNGHKLVDESTCKIDSALRNICVGMEVVRRIIKLMRSKKMENDEVGWRGKRAQGCSSYRQ
jgi:hypothetical protein